MFGIVGKEIIHACQSKFHDNKYRLQYQSKSADCVFYEDTRHASKAPVSVFSAEDKEHALIIRGEMYNLETLGCKKTSCLAEALWYLYLNHGEGLFNQLNGAYVLAIWDGTLKKLQIVRDRIGILQCFYGKSDKGLLFSGDPGRIKEAAVSSYSLFAPALVQYLLYCYNPGVHSLYANVNRLPPAHILHWESGRVRTEKYWSIRFDPDDLKPVDAWGHDVREALDEAVRIRRESRKTGAFLSGGLDSSSIVSLLNRQGETVLSTFSFRCRGESFDESHYAKIVADAVHANHQVIEYSAEDILETGSMVALMDEPFCDVGINVATYLLSKTAGGEAELLFTGDGGDELFAGHPVYMADKVGTLFRWIPPMIRNPLFTLGRSLPDSEQKKDWKVKLKRFSESYAFPQALGTQRWRIYYRWEDLADLLHPDILQDILKDDIFDPMIRFNQEANGPDALSRSLYADYQTVVQFYLRRMEMARYFGLSPRLPMLDPEIVELCARIPSRYKIRGWNDTKYIEKVAADPLLPREIVHRKDKLGHSIPLKNWIRDHERARSFVNDLISAPTLKKRGLFNPEFVQKMWDEHQARIRNHSHRLWALAVLELWMRTKGMTR
ncbi:hypothetical protein JW835_01740 [bacterium]|nr:hypothetical protein [bacterium]